jgi:hypothetical protein
VAPVAYRIVDEPTQSGWSRLAVRPLWPLLGLMLGGAWLGWPWFALNAIALGIQARWRTFAWIAAGLGGSAAIAFVSLARFGHSEPPDSVWPWAELAGTVWQLAVGYALFEEQSQTCELFVYFGGRVRNAMWVVAAAAFFGRERVVHAVLENAGSAADFVLMVLL